jgi:hypothetical protein
MARPRRCALGTLQSQIVVNRLAIVAARRAQQVNQRQRPLTLGEVSGLNLATSMAAVLVSWQWRPARDVGG